MIYLGMVFCTFLGLSCSNNDDISPNKPSVLDKYITVNQVQLHYRDWGNAAAPPLIILHIPWVG